MVSDSAAPWTAACQASLSITNSQSLLKLMFFKLVMPSNHLILCHPLLLLPPIFPSIRAFSNESVLHIIGQSSGVSALASVLPKNIQDWFPLRLTGLISLQSKGLSILQCAALFIDQLSELTQTHVHWVNDVIQSSHPQMSQFFTSEAKVMEFQLQHQSLQWILRTDFL